MEQLHGTHENQKTARATRERARSFPRPRCVVPVARARVLLYSQVTLQCHRRVAVRSCRRVAPQPGRKVNTEQQVGRERRAGGLLWAAALSGDVFLPK